MLAYSPAAVPSGSLLSRMGYLLSGIALFPLMLFTQALFQSLMSPL